MLFDSPLPILISGLAIFLLGVYLLSRHAEALAKDHVRERLQNITGRPLVALGSGLLTTAIVQSSSLISSLAVILTGSKLITIRSGILIFLGANIGTTILDQFIASPALGWGPYILFIGVILFLFSQQRHALRFASLVTITVGMIFLGIFLMSHAFSSAWDLSFQLQIVDLIQNPWSVFLAGIIITAVIQSSSASTGIALALVISGVVPAISLIPFFLGADIGTTITENIASLLTKRPGKVVARASFVFSLIVGLIIMSTLPQFTSFMLAITPETANPARLLANAHILVNVGSVLLALPFISQLEKLGSALVPKSK
ncbi:MAG: Na/Pi symporter [Patescibacteria group bacterium]